MCVYLPRRASCCLDTSFLKSTQRRHRSILASCFEIVLTLVYLPSLSRGSSTIRWGRVSCRPPSMPTDFGSSPFATLESRIFPSTLVFPLESLNALSTFPTPFQHLDSRLSTRVSGLPPRIASRRIWMNISSSWTYIMENANLEVPQ